MLHIISKSLFQSHSASTCTALLDEDDAVLLLGDGVYSVRHPLLSGLANIYIIEEDSAARGLPRSVDVHYIDYTTMVTLTENHNPVVTWR